MRSTLREVAKSEREKARALRRTGRKDRAAEAEKEAEEWDMLAARVEAEIKAVEDARK